MRSDTGKIEQGEEDAPLVEPNTQRKGWEQSRHDNDQQAPGIPEATLPDYLLRHYRWAYVAPAGVWLFDRQFMINAALFGQYQALMKSTLHVLEPENAGCSLQIASVYGKLVPTLAARMDDLHLVDVAPVQLNQVRRKLEKAGLSANLVRMNAEALDYPVDSFDTSLIFMLLHEMPPEARQRALAEAMRITRRGGRFVVAEYGEWTDTHPLHRFSPLRWILTRAEPFLDGFLRDNLAQRVREAAETVGKEAVLKQRVSIFGGFYRVLHYQIA